MKTTIAKKISSFILLLCGMFFSTVLNAQNCSGNKVWACRLDECHNQDCKCVNPNVLANWLATVPQCNFNSHWFDGFRNGVQDGIENTPSLIVYPNPVSREASTTTVLFSLEETQTVSLKVFDVSGRIIRTLADSEFAPGNYEVKWNADENSGIYFLRFQSAENQEMVKLIVNR